MRSLSLRLKCCTVASWPSSGGIGPESALWLRSRRSRSVVSLPSSGGIGPDRLFQAKVSISRCGRLPSWGGMGPVNSLAARLNDSKPVRLPSAGGIGPERLLSPRLRVSRLMRRRISSGMVPERLFPRSRRYVSSSRLPNSGGMGPERPCGTHPPASGSHRLASSTRVTRPPAFTVTPYQSPSGASLSQFVLSTQFGPSVAR